MTAPDDFVTLYHGDALAILPELPRESKIPPGCYLVAPFPLEDGATWGDLRRLVDLGQHYDDDAPIKLDWTEHYATNGQITTPSGVIVEGA